eukprot:scaffold14489_cov221-Alexandrium_tamarense.AAC.2
MSCVASSYLVDIVLSEESSVGSLNRHRPSSHVCLNSANLLVRMGGSIGSKHGSAYVMKCGLWRGTDLYILEQSDLVVTRRALAINNSRSLVHHCLPGNGKTNEIEFLVIT